jgi:TonB-dependent receptor
MRRIGTLLKAVSVTAIAMGVSGQVLAQDKTEAQAAAESETASAQDQIIVTGFRGALGDALGQKRDASNIGEAISSDDIGTLPALDLAEALQVIPGVQVNRENDDGAFRLGEISLRGLPGSFTNTTANGQTFAPPSGSVQPAQGVPNSFGAFSSRVFDGVFVNKSFRADLVEGGIAGTIDKRLAKALSKPEFQLVVSAGAQYEELADQVVGNFFAAGSYHIIPDRLAVTFRAAHEQESFRRDSFNITQYRPLTEDAANRRRGGFVGANGETLAEFKAANGIAAGESILYPSQIRQITETQDGYRTAIIAGAEFQATPTLKFGADLLYSDRQLDSQTNFFLAVPAGITTSITPTSTPFAGFANEDGSTTWVLPGYDYEDITYAQSARGGGLSQESIGGFFNVDWETENWLVQASAAYSEATFLRLGTNYQAQYLSAGGNNFATNGTFGSVNSGSGNADDYFFTLNLDPAITQFGTNLDLAYAATGNTAAQFVQVASPIGTNRFFSAGNEVFRDRDDLAFNLDIERQLDWGWLRSIKVGGRYNEQTVDSSILFLSIAGLDTSSLSNALFEPGAADFFGGNAPGAYFGSEWEFPNIAATEGGLLQNGVSNPNNAAISPFSGFIYQTNADGSLRGFETRASTKTTISAAYGMVNFEGDLFAGMSVQGNAGVRYVETKLQGEGFGRTNGVVVPSTATNTYDHFLPAVNAAIRITPNLYLRLAYSEALNRPNPAGFTPSLSINEVPGDGGTIGRVDVQLPGTEVEAFTSQNYDISLEWYNRNGSLFSIAAYRKDVNSFIDTRLVCPGDGGGLGFGTLSQTDLGGGLIECRIDSDNREIRITETFNFDTTIRIEGLEIAAQQDLSFLENPFLRGFGVQASIAFLDVSGDDAGGNPAIIPRISDTSYNVAGYWENKNFSARLAYNWRSEYFLEGGLSITGAEDRQVKARGQLDFITRYNVTKDLVVDFRAFNLTDVLYEEFQSGNELMNRNTAYDGRTFSLGVTYKF